MTPCDRHPTARAVVTATLPDDGPLSFCGHCWHEHAPDIRRRRGVLIADERNTR